MKAVLLIDFGSTYTKVTAVDVEKEEILGTAQSFTTIETDIMDGLTNAVAILRSKIGDIEFAEQYACGRAACVAERIEQAREQAGIHLIAVIQREHTRYNVVDRRHHAGKAREKYHCENYASVGVDEVNGEGERESRAEEDTVDKQVVAKLQVYLARHKSACDGEEGENEREYDGKGILHAEFVLQKLGKPVVYAVLDKAVGNSRDSDENERDDEECARLASCRRGFCRRAEGEVVLLKLAVFLCFFYLCANCGKQRNGSYNRINNYRARYRNSDVCYYDGSG